MRACAIIVLTAAILVGCSNEKSVTATSPDQDPSPAVEPTKSVNANTAREETASSVQRARASNPPITQNPVAMTAQEAASDHLNAQAKNEIEGGVISATTQYHSKFENDPRQGDWASYVEENLKRHFASTKFSTLDIAKIECKSTICELIAVTRDPSTVDISMRNWQREIAMLPREEWWRAAQMKQLSSSFSEMRDGRGLFVTYLGRNTQSNKSSRAAP